MNMKSVFTLAFETSTATNMEFNILLVLLLCIQCQFCVCFHHDKDISDYIARHEATFRGEDTFGPVALSYQKKYFSKPEFEEGNIYKTLHGDDVSEFLSNLNVTKVKNLHITLLGNKENRTNLWHVDLSPLIKLQKLESLWLVQNLNFYEYSKFFQFTFTDDLENKNILSHFKTFYIDLYAEEFVGLHDLLKRMPNLNVFAAKNTKRMFAPVHSQLQSLVQVLASKPIKAICFTGLQSLSSSAAMPKLNISEIFYPLKNSPVEYLDISHNDFMTIIPAFAVVFPQLKYLDISYNNVGLSPDISTYRMNVLYDLPIMKHIEVLNMNSVSRTCGSDYSHNRKKRSADISDLSTCMKKSNATINTIFANPTMYCKVLYCMGIYQGIACQDIPKFTLTDILSIINQKDCVSHLKLPVPISLKEFYLDKPGEINGDYGHVRMDRGTFCLNSTNLEVLHCTHSAEYLHNYQYVFKRPIAVKGFDNLHEVDITSMKVSPRLDWESFHNLKRLYIGDTAMDGSSLKAICKKLTQLEILDLSNNNLTKFTSNIFDECSSLKILDLSTNSLKRVPLGINNLKNLKFLSLKNNNLTDISVSIQTQLNDLAATGSLIEVDLTGNPLFCGCSNDAIDTVTWIMHSYINFTNKQFYRCTGRDGFQLVTNININHLWQECFFPPYLKAIAAGLFVVVFILLWIFLYKLRHKIRIWIFRIKWYFRTNKKPKIPAQCSTLVDDSYSIDEMEEMIDSNSIEPFYTYDAFLSYCAEDRFLVHDIFVKTLEKQYGFKLCVHYRDFPACGTLAEVIHEYFSKSRCAIVFLSTTYFKKEWCYFELDLAYRKAIQQNKNLIVVKLGNMPQTSESTPRIVADILESQIYIDYPDDKYEGLENYDKKLNTDKQMELFWAKLVSALYGEVMCECCGICDWMCCCKTLVQHQGYQSLSIQSS